MAKKNFFSYNENAQQLSLLHENCYSLYAFVFIALLSLIHLSLLDIYIFFKIRTFIQHVFVMDLGKLLPQVFFNLKIDYFALKGFPLTLVVTAVPFKLHLAPSVYGIVHVRMFIYF